MSGFAPVGDYPVASLPDGTGGINVTPPKSRLNFRAGGGFASLGTGTYSLTVGHMSVSGPPSEDFWGWSNALPIGSINSPAMPNGATMIALYWENNHTAGTRVLHLVVSGVVANSGWENIVIDGHTHQRSTASFDTSTGNTIWSWTTTNHFGNTDGAVKTVTISGSAPIVDAGGVNISKAEAALWLDPVAGISVSKLETALWLESDKFQVSKLEVALWLDPEPAADGRRRMAFMR